MKALTSAAFVTSPTDAHGARALAVDAEPEVVDRQMGLVFRLMEAGRQLGAGDAKRDLAAAWIAEATGPERCTTCHGVDGQGVSIGDKKPGPLWGPDSWNDGAGAARVYTLAGIIRYSMPYLNPGSLTDEEAQQLAAFINAKPRPEYPGKAEDYRTEKLPVDAVYYRRRGD